MTPERAVEFLKPYAWECPHGSGCEHCEAIVIVLAELERLRRDKERLLEIVNVTSFNSNSMAYVHAMAEISQILCGAESTDGHPKKQGRENTDA